MGKLQEILSIQNTDNLPALLKHIPLSFAAIPPAHYQRIYQHALEEIISGFYQQDPQQNHKTYRSHRPPVGQHPHQHLLLPFTKQVPNKVRFYFGSDKAKRLPL